MQRDWGLIRLILRMIEEKPSYGDVVRPDAITGYDDELVSYHLHILDQAGLITAKCKDTRSGIFCVAMNLTWDGHELLDSIKSETVWNQLRNVFREKSIDLSYAAVKTAALSIIKHNFLLE